MVLMDTLKSCACVTYFVKLTISLAPGLGRNKFLNLVWLPSSFFGIVDSRSLLMYVQR